MMNKAIIGITGYARAGKDTLAAAISSALNERKINNKIFSFAHALKSDIDKFCIDKIGISAFVEDSTLKSKIRPILISYGNIQRTLTNGTYWINKIKPEIDDYLLNNNGIAIIPDLRFKEYEYDEYDFVRSYSRNLVVTVSRILPDGRNNEPAHETEKNNFPFFLENSDMNLLWETYKDHDNIKTDAINVLNLIK